jgi:hypothetical protein
MGGGACLHNRVGECARAVHRGPRLLPRFPGVRLGFPLFVCLPLGALRALC